jgi:hypothetical protein
MLKDLSVLQTQNLDPQKYLKSGGLSPFWGASIRAEQNRVTRVGTGGRSRPVETVCQDRAGEGTAAFRRSQIRSRRCRVLQPATGARMACTGGEGWRRAPRRVPGSALQLHENTGVKADSDADEKVRK